MVSDHAVLAIGLMSGTSLDGVDAALLRTDGARIAEPLGFHCHSYTEQMRAEIRAVLGQGHNARTERLGLEIARVHAEAIGVLIAQTGTDRAQVSVAGFHGQTIHHAPRRGVPGRGVTVQIGAGDWLAREIGIDVVFDFRAADVAAGGEGAPLAPSYHAALVATALSAGRLQSSDLPVAVLNLGGVGNLTWISRPEADDLLAFDCGPGNAMIDDWCLAHTGRAVDLNGALAAGGTVNEASLARLLENPYFAAPPPKSLDRNAFGISDLAGLSPADGAATLTAFTAASVAAAIAHCPAPPKRWLVCGGGRHNPSILGALRVRVGVPVDPVEVLGWDGDALEAQAFAYLAVRSLRGLPLSFPGTTAVPEPMPGGVLARHNA